MRAKRRPAFSAHQARPGENSSLTGQGLLGKMPQSFDEFIHGEFIIEFLFQTAISRRRPLMDRCRRGRRRSLWHFL